MRMVATKKECEDAAVFLKVTQKSAFEHTLPQLPPGCIYQKMHGFTWLYMNNHQESSVPCGKVEPFTFKCICAAGKLLKFKELKNQITKSSIKRHYFSKEIQRLVMFAANCSDGKQNQGETDVDCGGPCLECETCYDGVKNQGEDDIDCGGPCTACPTCNDGIQNQGEIDVDCGGPCPTCPTCDDGIQNQGETATDCGGPCAKCRGMKNKLQGYK